MSNTLLPCPFCGGEAGVTTRDVEPQADPWYGKNMQTFIVCAKCGACLFDEYFHYGFTDEREAIAVWNRRPDAVSVVRGEWKRMISPYGELEGFICACGRTSQSADNYCPNCGAKMEDKP